MNDSLVFPRLGQPGVIGRTTAILATKQTVTITEVCRNRIGPSTEQTDDDDNNNNVTLHVDPNS